MFVIKKDPIVFNGKYSIRRKDTSVVYVRESDSLDSVKAKVHMDPSRNTRYVVNNAILDMVIQCIRNNGPFDEFEKLDFGSDVKEMSKLKRAYIEEHIHHILEKGD